RAGSMGGDGLQLSLDFDHVGRGAAGAAGGGGPAADAGAPGAVAGSRDGARAPERFDDLPTALGATIADPGRIELVSTGDMDAVGEWLSTHDAVGASIVFDDPRPRRGQAQAFAVAGADGRVLAAAGSG